MNRPYRYSGNTCGYETNSQGSKRLAFGYETTRLWVRDDQARTKWPDWVPNVLSAKRPRYGLTIIHNNHPNRLGVDTTKEFARRQWIPKSTLAHHSLGSTRRALESPLLETKMSWVAIMNLDHWIQWFLGSSLASLTLIRLIWSMIVALVNSFISILKLGCEPTTLLV